MDILQKIKECIAENLEDTSADSIADNARLKEDLFADSLDILQIRISIENAFLIEFSEKELTCMLTVDAIYQAVKEKVG